MTPALDTSKKAANTGVPLLLPGKLGGRIIHQTPFFYIAKGDSATQPEIE